MHVVMQSPETEVLSRRQAAARLGVTAKTLARWAQQGRGPAYSLSGEEKGRALYAASAIVEWLVQRRQNGSR